MVDRGIGNDVIERCARNIPKISAVLLAKPQETSIRIHKRPVWELSFFRCECRSFGTGVFVSTWKVPKIVFVQSTPVLIPV